MKILAIETSCDETGAAIVEKAGSGVRILAEVKATSAGLHNKYGGIVPEVAAREQVKVMIPVIVEAMEKAEVDKDEIGAIAVAHGPGLMGSLLIGVETAKALAWGWEKKLIGVNHMAAHVLANWIVDEPLTEVPKLPAVGLVVSGGHTDLIYMKDEKNWEWIGGTRDDAAGQCLDKCARALGLPYPGGPAIEAAAEKAVGKVEEKLPRPMLQEAGVEMSFSGLKTALVKIVENKKVSEDKVNLWARELNEAMVEILVKKTTTAAREKRVKTIVLAGGVAANRMLREKLTKQAEVEGIRLWMPKMAYCTDNAAMIGAAAVIRPETIEIDKLQADPGLMVV